MNTKFNIWMYKPGMSPVAFVFTGGYDDVYEAGKALASAMGYMFSFIEEVNDDH